MKRDGEIMIKKLFLALIFTGFIAYSPGNAFALEKTNIYIAVDYFLNQYDHVTINTISLGRTNRQTVIAAESGVYSKHYSFMNFTYTDRILVTASWYARGEQANPVNNTWLMLYPETIREKTKNDGIHLHFSPDRIELR